MSSTALSATQLTQSCSLQSCVVLSDSVKLLAARVSAATYRLEWAVYP